jgi:hypothetical protein
VNSNASASNGHGIGSNVCDADVTSLDHYRRDAIEAAADEDRKATKRFINAMILKCEADADGCVREVLGREPTPLECETWAFNKGKAEGLRLALRALRSEGAS